jgi:hypothetical protein
MREIKLLKSVDNAHGHTPRGAVVRWPAADAESLVDAGKAVWHAIQEVAHAVSKVRRARPHRRKGA